MNLKYRVVNGLILFVSIGLNSVAVYAQNNRPNVEPARVSEAPIIDGLLNDEVWQSATLVNDFKQIQPVLGVTPSEKTEVYLAYDSDNLYIAFRAFDSAPEEIVATELRRDGDLGAGDNFVVFIDTFSDRRNAFGFGMTPLGAMVDARVENNNSASKEWNGIWNGNANIDDLGWTAEMAIPFKTLSFDPDNDSWGLELIRRIKRNNERIRWANISQNRDDIYVGAYGDMSGLKGMDQGLGLDLRPTFSVRSVENRPGQISNQSVLAGGDIIYRVTPSLTAHATINSDFSDAPVDQVQNNLGRFSLFFPETRDFFLNDADIFQFGGLDEENGIPFFSRRMGIINTGEALDIKYGGKLTGRVGNLNIGLLNTQIESAGSLDSQNLSVLRASLGIMDESRVGFIATDGDPNSNNGSSLYGADYQYRNSYFGGDKVVVADAWMQKSENPGISDDNMAYGVKFDYPNDKVSISTLLREIQGNFQPKLGFVNRSGIRQSETRGRLRKRFDGDSLFRIIEWGFRYNRIEDMDGNIESENRILKVIELRNQDNDRLEVNYLGNREVLTTPFQISSGVIIPAGDYKYERARVRLRTSNGRPISAEMYHRWGSFYTGKIAESELKLEWRVSPNLFTGVNYQYVDADLPQGKFDYTVTRVNVDFIISARLMIQNLVQHNSRTNSLGLNTRFRWELEPGNELFLVFNQGWDVEDGSYMPIETNLTAKVRWTYRF